MRFICVSGFNVEFRGIYFAKYYGGGGGEWLLGKKMKTEGVGEKKMKKKGKGEKGKKGLKNGLKTHL